MCILYKPFPKKARGERQFIAKQFIAFFQGRRALLRPDGPGGGNFVVAAAVIIAVIVVCAAFWLWAIAPGGKADFSEFRKFDYAHRGLHNKENGVPENSETAFSLAALCGFGMEFDLQLTQDNYVVVHHDHTILRTCGEDKLISDLTLGELHQYRLFGTQEKVPLFSDVLKLVDGRTPLIIELKGYNDPELLCSRVMEELMGYKGLYCVESFDPRIVRWFRKNRPEIVRGQLMERLEKGQDGMTASQAFFGRNLMTNFLTRPQFEAYDFHNRDVPSLYAARRVFGMQEVSWTLRKEEDYKKAKALGNLCIFEGFLPAQTEELGKRSFQDILKAHQAAVCGTVQTRPN